MCCGHSPYCNLHARQSRHSTELEHDYAVCNQRPINTHSTVPIASAMLLEYCNAAGSTGCLSSARVGHHNMAVGVCHCSMQSKHLK